MKRSGLILFVVALCAVYCLVALVDANSIRVYTVKNASGRVVEVVDGDGVEHEFNEIVAVNLSDSEIVNDGNIEESYVVVSSCLSFK